MVARWRYGLSIAGIFIFLLTTLSCSNGNFGVVCNSSGARTGQLDHFAIQLTDNLTNPSNQIYPVVNQELFPSTGALPETSLKDFITRFGDLFFLPPDTYSMTTGTFPSVSYIASSAIVQAFMIEAMDCANNIVPGYSGSATITTTAQDVEGLTPAITGAVFDLRFNTSPRFGHRLHPWLRCRSQRLPHLLLQDSQRSIAFLIR